MHENEKNEILGMFFIYFKSTSEEERKTRRIFQ